MSLTNHDFQWGRSEVIIICPDSSFSPSDSNDQRCPLTSSPQVQSRISAPLLPGLQGSEGLGHIYQWIGLRENLQESPIFNGKIYGFL